MAKRLGERFAAARQRLALIRARTAASVRSSSKDVPLSTFLSRLLFFGAWLAVLGIGAAGIHHYRGIDQPTAADKQIRNGSILFVLVGIVMPVVGIADISGKFSSRVAVQ